jgi:hypothetical protein
MNAHPHSVPLAPEPEAPTLPDASRSAQHLLLAAKTLVPQFEAGKPIDAAALRAAMEEAFGASDTSGAWVWKDGYEAAEIAQIQMLSRYGALMQRQAATPQAFLAMIERLAGLAPSHTRRSEDSIRLQQFSTPSTELCTAQEPKSALSVLFCPRLCCKLFQRQAFCGSLLR